MVYTPQEKQRMDHLLQVFQDYVDSYEFYDIVYSPKAGFLRICVGEGADEIYFPITSFENMLAMFINDFLSDEEDRVESSLDRDYDRVRKLLTPLLNRLGDDRDYAFARMEQEFENCRKRSEQFRQEQLAMIRETEELLKSLRQSIKP